MSITTWVNRSSYGFADRPASSTSASSADGPEEAIFIVPSRLSPSNRALTVSRSGTGDCRRLTTLGSTGSLPSSPAMPATVATDAPGRDRRTLTRTSVTAPCPAAAPRR